MQQESNAKNKQIESLNHLIEGINKLKTDVLDGTVIIESTYASRETNHQVPVSYTHLTLPTIA